MAEFHRMDATAELQASPRQPHRFTKENAKLFSVRGWQASREARAKMKADALKLRQVTPQAERLASQVKQLEDLMDGETDADVLAKLAGAHSKLFATWQVLTGTPNPGSRRVKASRPSSASVETVQVVSDQNQI
jgi:hypothetical protein